LLVGMVLLIPLTVLAQTAEPGDRLLSPVVVTATRSAQSGFDLPLSIDRIEQNDIRQGRAMVNLSESLPRVPGIVVRNRNNYAQDLQISSRGFGARSTFGVRGLRLYADGIPATMPDGQGQSSNFDLASAERIEVLRGPFSALYGNSSGGVLAIFTESGQPGYSLSSFAQAGTHDSSRLGLKSSGQSGRLNHVASLSRFDTEGYREHSAATRDTANLKLRLTDGPDMAVTLVGNAVAMRDVQDPLGLTREQFEADPRSAGQNAERFNTRKSVRQQQLGANVEKQLNREDLLSAMLYGGHRATLQYQAIPTAAQAAPTSAGGVIDLARDYAGLDLRWTREQMRANGKWQWSLGLAYDLLREDRRGYENFSGASLGVKGRLRRKERNQVYNLDQYAQLQWEPDARWLWLVGLRHSAVSVDSDDDYLAPGNGDDSGAVRFDAFNPVFGATFKAAPGLHLYASYGKGFETPTLNELSYRPGAPAAAGFNFALDPARGDHLELGLKARLTEQLRLNLAAFHVDTHDELTVLSSDGGRAIFQNAGKTRRDGVELALEGRWSNGWSAQLAYSWLRAVYAQAFCSGACSAETRVASGNRIPGIPCHSLYGELAWRDPVSGLSAALEAHYVGKVMVNDANSDATAAYAIGNLRLAWEQDIGAWKLQQFLRIDNVFDRAHIGSVIVNESNQRYFEPAAGRNYLVGLSLSHSW
jgi:iron complex outermembrane recepter protein